MAKSEAKLTRMLGSLQLSVPVLSGPTMEFFDAKRLMQVVYAILRHISRSTESQILNREDGIRPNPRTSRGAR